MTAAVAIAALLIVAWLTREALVRSDRATRAEIAQANAESAMATWQTTADTSERLRRAEKMRADALEEELSRVEQARADHPDVLARARLREKWRVSSEVAAAAPENRDDPGPVSDPEAARPES